MKKITFLFTLIALLLTACGNTQVGSAQTSNNLPAVTQLALGTLQLKGTDQAVTNDQAQELLPLWQIYQELSNSDNAAQAEFEAVAEQIQETMTAEQMQAITDMKLTQQDVSEVVQAHKITSSNSNSNSNNANSAPSNSGMPAGGPPEAGGAPFGNGMGGPPTDGGIGGLAGAGSAGSGTGAGQNQETGAGPGLGSSAGVPTVLIDAVIEYLGQMVST